MLCYSKSWQTREQITNNHSGNFKVLTNIYGIVGFMLCVHELIDGLFHLAMLTHSLAECQVVTPGI